MSKKKVLVVDDEDGVLRLVEIVLQRSGCVVVTATTGEEGVRKVRSDRPGSGADGHLDAGNRRLRSSPTYPQTARRAPCSYFSSFPLSPEWPRRFGDCV